MCVLFIAKILTRLMFHEQVLTGWMIATSQLTQSQHTRQKGQWQEHGEQNIAGWPSSRNLVSSVLQ